MVIGKVKKIKIGLIYTLSNTKMSATRIAIGKLLTSTPGISVAMRNTARAVEAILTKNFI